MQVHHHNNWQTVKLDDITTKIGSGATPRGGKESYKDEGIALIRSLNIYDLAFEEDGLAFIDYQQAENLANVEVQPNDVLINITGASVARCCIVPANVLPARVNQHVSIIRVDEACADPHFVSYSLVSPQYKRQLLSIAQAGATREALTKSTLEQFQIALPPLPTQHKIAAILSAYDDLIENNRRRIAILEEMARLIYREWFVHFRFPGHEDVEMVESEVGVVPEGWGVEKLSELVSTQYGYTESASEEKVGPKFVRGTDINKTSYIDWGSVPYCPIEADDYDKFRLEVGDIVVVRMADPGKPGMVESEVDAVFASYLIRFKIKSDKLLPYYLYYFLMSDRYQNWATGASTGTTRKSASAKVLTNIHIVLPPLELQKEFDKHVSGLRRLLNTLLAQNAKLRETRDLLLPRLVSGEVGVSEIEISIDGVEVTLA